MKRLERLQEMLDDEALTMDGYDDCILGYCEQYGRPAVVAYDLEKVMAKLKKGGLDDIGAREYFEFNQVGAWMGEYTPVFVKVVK